MKLPKPACKLSKEGKNLLGRHTDHIKAMFDHTPT
jgi:hypothetical protein